MRHFPVILFTGIIAFYCSGLQRSETARLESVPEIRPVATKQVRATRYVNENEPATVSVSFQDKTGLDAGDLKLFEQRLLSYVQKSKRVTVKQDDAVFKLEFDLSPDPDSPEQRILKAVLTDTRSGNSYPELTGYLQANRSPSGRVDFAPDLAVVPEISKTEYTFSEDYEKQLLEWLSKTGKGKLVVQSSRPAKILVRKPLGLEELGETPLEIDIMEGQYELIAMRRGHEPNNRIVEVNAASEGRWLATWSDDTEVSSIVILSQPPELRLAVDNIVTGRTPAAIVGTEPGEIPVELSEKKEDSSQYIVRVTDTISLSPGEAFERAYLLDYFDDFSEPFRTPLWQAASNAGPIRVEPAGEGLLASPLRPAKNSGQSFAGLLSAPFSLETKQIEFLIKADSSTRILLLSDEDKIQFSLNKSGVSALVKRSGKSPGIAYDATGEGPAYRRLIVLLEKTETGYEMKSEIDGQGLLYGPVFPGDGFRVGIVSDSGLVGVKEMKVLSYGNEQNLISRWFTNLSFFFSRMTGGSGSLR